jgi:hypothetical protein
MFLYALFAVMFIDSLRWLRGRYLRSGVRPALIPPSTGSTAPVT